MQGLFLLGALALVAMAAAGGGKPRPTKKPKRGRFDRRKPIGFYYDPVSKKHIPFQREGPP